MTERALAAEPMELYPVGPTIDGGHLAVGDGNRIAWTVFGSPHGRPAVVLHGGPGQGGSAQMTRALDPERYRIVLFDQRGCGQSLPHASDPDTAMDANTTVHLMRDIETLRNHLGIERWLVAGGSWGAALALAYAQSYPEHVGAMVLTAITTFRPRETRWLYRGLSAFFPEAWLAFRDHVTRSDDPDAIIAAYSQRMETHEPTVRDAAARAWCAWEDAALSLEEKSGANEMPERDRLAFVRICTHYLRHNAWLEDGQLIHNARRLAKIPGILIHGRRDLTCPAETAYALANAWPGAKLVLLDDAGHHGGPSTRSALLRAFDHFASS